MKGNSSRNKRKIQKRQDKEENLENLLNDLAKGVVIKLRDIEKENEAVEIIETAFSDLLREIERKGD